ncbi:uncharacterized protein BDW43DRAFT_276557 [Aspergillus alliaceus]|uniref:uncharacterized protein n=1 Tax=Petromyces alliaceus TaxID=209559 RepID=UPI0012A5F899|nr:uncharacterized protein BDW43DRAFT_276557 [Aspergillus alliaceus]KAB8233522.1 hypothetical protein BDW43DRAFT_276557 [Aspergillus alliaceus]
MKYSNPHPKAASENESFTPRKIAQIYLVRPFCEYCLFCQSLSVIHFAFSAG